MIIFLETSRNILNCQNFPKYFLKMSYVTDCGCFLNYTLISCAKCAVFCLFFFFQTLPSYSMRIILVEATLIPDLTFFEYGCFHRQLFDYDKKKKNFYCNCNFTPCYKNKKWNRLWPVTSRNDRFFNYQFFKDRLSIKSISVLSLEEFRKINITKLIPF